MPAYVRRPGAGAATARPCWLSQNTARVGLSFSGIGIDCASLERTSAANALLAVDADTPAALATSRTSILDPAPARAARTCRTEAVNCNGSTSVIRPIFPRRAACLSHTVEGTEHLYGYPAHMTVWLVALALGAAGRLTRLVTRDVIAAPLRAHVIARYGPRSHVATWIGCPWCIGLWISGLVALLAYLSHGAGWFTVPAAALSINLLYAWGAQHLDP